MNNALDRSFAVAPMLDWTDTHCRYLMRLISRHTLLYTEMVTTGALLHGDRAYHLDFNAMEQPLALQLGGSEPGDLAQCARLGEQWGYNEINLNCGCPSDRVQSGRFGACLMAEPRLVADCLKAMSDAVSIPVTIKCRIGIDHHESYQEFCDFVGSVTNITGCHTVIVHARKAWLKGLSPKENREIPPLHYDYVYRLKQELPALEVIINGGITTLEDASEHLKQVDGVMMGREAYHNPFILQQVDHLFYHDDHPLPTRREICEQFIGYSRQQMDKGLRLHFLSKHLLGLYHEVPGARKFRRFISENAHRENAGIEVLEQALQLVA
jgi:tRNA-dihydrouridine synthase A